MKPTYTEQQFDTLLREKLFGEFGVKLEEASNQQIYRALALLVRQRLSDDRKRFTATIPSRCTTCAWSSSWAVPSKPICSIWAGMFPPVPR